MRLEVDHQRVGAGELLDDGRQPRLVGPGAQLGQPLALAVGQLAQPGGVGLGGGDGHHVLEDLVEQRHEGLGAHAAGAVHLQRDLHLAARRQRPLEVARGDVQRADHPVAVGAHALALDHRDLQQGLLVGPGRSASTVWCTKVRRAGSGVPLGT
jgi:hypothetical protein